jgi:pimeloyl-ACP methyl ester carboxylesterase
VRSQLFKFANDRGQAIKGMVCGPDAPSLRRTGVVYLPGIVLGTTAVHRLGLEIARAIADTGVSTCLFDPSGVGESEGDYPAGTHQQLAVWVEGGSCVADTVRAIEVFRARAHLEHVILIGHCGGALTAMYVAARERAVSGALLICPPTVAMGSAHELEREGVAEQYLREYVRKLRSPEAWRRLLRGESSYATMARLAVGKAKRQVRRRIDRLKARLVPTPRSPSGPPVPAAPTRAFNPRFAASVRTAIALGKRLEIVFGDRDPDVDDFRAFRTEHLPAGVTTRIFDDTSHGFVTEDSMRLLLDEIGRFVAAA